MLYTSFPVLFLLPDLYFTGISGLSFSGKVYGSVVTTLLFPSLVQLLQLDTLGLFLLYALMLLLGLVHLSTPLGPWTSCTVILNIAECFCKDPILEEALLGAKQPFASLNRGLLYFILITVIFCQFLEYLLTCFKL